MICSFPATVHYKYALSCHSILFIQNIFAKKTEADSPIKQSQWLIFAYEKKNQIKSIIVHV